MSTLLENLSIELVLTAHPTEARRRTVLTKIERIAQLLQEISNKNISAREHDKLLNSMRSEISALWLTERARASRLAVTDEVKTGLYYVDAFFWKAIPAVYDDLEKAIQLHYPELQPPPTWLKLASWIGGDRDGNPNVTTEVTAETLRLHRGLTVENHRRKFQELARRLSMSSRLVPPPPELLTLAMLCNTFGVLFNVLIHIHQNPCFGHWKPASFLIGFVGTTFQLSSLDINHSARIPRIIRLPNNI